MRSSDLDLEELIAARMKVGGVQQLEDSNQHHHWVLATAGLERCRISSL